MSSCDSILKWAKEAKVLLRQGDTAAVRTNLSMIVSLEPINLVGTASQSPLSIHVICDIDMSEAMDALRSR